MFHDRTLQNHDTEALAAMGSDMIAYMRYMSPQEIDTLFPNLEAVQPDQGDWALFAANGEPLMLAEDRDELAATAFYNDLQTILPN